jgi:hypothetical protein
MTTGRIIGVVLAVAVLFAIVQYKPQPHDADAQFAAAMTTARIERLVKARLRDPGSATFQHMQAGCGLVNARNGLGGMAGNKPFIVGQNDRVIFEEDGKAEFKALWNGHCQG